MMEDQTFTLSWDVKIVNVRETGKMIKTNPFVARILNDTTWMCYVSYGIQDPLACISLYLMRCLDKCPDSISVEAILQLIEVNGTPGKNITLTKIFDQNEGIFFEVFLTWGEVERLYLHNDSLKIRCVLSKTNKELTTKTLFAHTTGHLGKISRKWGLKNFSQMNPGILAKHTVGLSRSRLLFDVRLSIEERPCGDVITFQFNRRCDPSYKSISVKVMITVLDTQGIESGSWKQDQHLFHMRTAEEIWEFPHVFRKDDFLGEAIDYLVNGTLYLKVEITLCLGTMTSEIEKTAYSMEANHIQTANHFAGNMKDLYISKRLADVKLRSYGETVPAHRFVLHSRSKTFAEMLDKMGGTYNDVLDVHDVDMITLKRMLKYMYTDEIDDLQYDEAIVAYIAAHKYWIESLKCKYSHILQSYLKVTNVRSILMLADNFCDPDLTICALDFIIQYWNSVRQNVLGT